MAILKDRIAVLYGEPAENAGPDEMDSLHEAETVLASLNRLGYEAKIIPVTLDISAMNREIAHWSPCCVFNLVESIAGKGIYQSIIPIALDALNLPYTGCKAVATQITSSKTLTKVMLKNQGIATPWWQEAVDFSRKEIDLDSLPFPLIRKLTSEDASVDINDTAIMANAKQLKHWLESLNKNRLRDYFVEGFIDGREFNLSLLEQEPGEIRILPPAEIRFVDFPQEKPKILGYTAKWDTESFEYKHTVRSFDFPDTDKPLLAQLKRCALACWHILHCAGYIRVDFRVDGNNIPYVLEINTNPCISPDAGFVASCQTAGISYDHLIQKIVDNGLKHGTGGF